MGKIKRITSLAELGKLAGVTAATASRALADSAEISVKTKEKIKALAKEYNYTINANARSLRMKKTNAIAVLLNSPDELSGTVSAQPFVSDVIARISDALAARGLDMNLSSERHLGGGCWDQYYLQAKRADGLIVLGQADNAKRLNELVELGTPFVVMGAYSRQRNYCVVGCDGKKSGMVATNHLIQDCKRKRILFIGPLAHYETEQRCKGYKKALEEAGMEVNKSLMIECDHSAEHAQAMLEQQLQEKGLFFDAVFASSDELAFGVMQALTKSNISIPKDVCVMGYDNIRASKFVTPSLTTISQNLESIVEHLIDAMLKRIAGETVKSVEIPFELVIRASTRGSM